VNRHGPARRVRSGLTFGRVVGGAVGQAVGESFGRVVGGSVERTA